MHPDDRENVQALLHGYIRELFDEGMTRRESEYRILDRETHAYVLCRATILRINLENPRQHRVLLIWRKDESPVSEQSVQTDHIHTESVSIVDQLLGGIHKCRCDQYFTLLRVSHSLLDLLHYSEQEIAEQFHNRLIELIYPPDRDIFVRQFRSQRNQGRMLELEYRLSARDGSLVWVSDRCLVMEEDGIEVAYCVLMDVTRSQKAEEALRLSLERHKIIMEQTNDIIFEWDINRDELYLSSNWEKQYGYPPITKDIRHEIPRVSHLHPDDMPVFTELMNAMSAGVSYKEAEFRIADIKGTYRWRKARATAQFDMDHKPFKVVGVIVDIDSQRTEKATLEDRAARDILTGLYNKVYARQRIENCLKDCTHESLSALMLLDVDDFKLINDRYGHMFGDAVLSELSAAVVKLFRGQDTLARVGGDEFLIFMPDILKEDVARQRAGDILNTLQNLFQEEFEKIPFSCSIGIDFAKGRHGSFQDMFEHADRALYRAKAAGKNQFTCYLTEMAEGPVGTALADTPGRRTEIDSNQKKQWSLSALTRRAFDILYDAAEFEDAVNSILELIGKLFEISRTYIFESSKDGQRSNNTFEWCAKGIEPQIKVLQQIPYVDEGHDYRDNFGGDGLFYCQNTRNMTGWEQELLKGQSIRSTLQYAIRENGIFHGFVGFDDCKIHRLWTGEQIEALTFIGKLLSVFLLKNRVQEALEESVLNLHSVLDQQESWMYVLDPDTYMLRYVNGRTRELVPDAEPGRSCYEVFYNREIPCENCVLKKARETGQSTMEMYNDVLKLCILADASLVQWNRQEACLVCCRDISHYKEIICSKENECMNCKEEKVNG